MNKIEEKVLESLKDLITNFNYEDEFTLKQLKKYQSIVKGEYSNEDITYLMEDYVFLNDVFEYAKLNPYQKGYMMKKTFEVNASVLKDSEPYSLIREDIYQKKLASVGIQNTKDFIKYYKEYIETKEIKEDVKHKDKVILFLQLVQSVEEEYRQSILKDYTSIDTFIKNPTQKEYSNVLLNITSLEIPDVLVDSFLIYLKKKLKEEKKEIIFHFDRELFKKREVPNVSRKSLRRELNAYETGEKFDFKNYERALFCMKILNIPEKRLEEVVPLLNNKAILNTYFYRYLFNKNEFLNLKEEERNEILVVFQNMLLCSDEEYVFWKEYILELLNKLKNNSNIKYDISLIKKI